VIGRGHRPHQQIGIGQIAQIPVYHLLGSGKCGLDGVLGSHDCSSASTGQPLPGAGNTRPVLIPVNGIRPFYESGGRRTFIRVEPFAMRTRTADDVPILGAPVDLGPSIDPFDGRAMRDNEVLPGNRLSEKSLALALPPRIV
jgi:hypothetical protein